MRTFSKSVAPSAWATPPLTWLRHCMGTDFDPTFSSTEHAPLALEGKPLRLHVLVDASSVEVYAENARGEQVVLTDQIFPDPSSTDVDFFADNGTAKLTGLQAWRLASIWK
ncbi:GH32 C-terminal domain-containing protein [Streptomyces sp. NBC_00271]|uniref:GH32 C-terminal domain-containing protein n=1 Tax=Streptomyces sp. NBC_00271 TaxID=2975697 RepID=UPI000EB2CA1E|nr:GH32 C-terminal domain-containing protein [Streptomyces sp. NBC_00271]